MDSLGRMRNMSRGAILENQIIHRCYAYWMIGVMTDHWNVCGEFIPACFVESMKGVVPPWVELFMRGVGNDQDMFGFIFLGALQDSRMDPGQAKVRLKLGYADLFCFLVYLLMAFPIPQLLYALPLDEILNPIFHDKPSPIFGPPHVINSACDTNWIMSSCSGHRWYLFMIVWAHLCMALGQLLRMPGWLQAIGQFVLCIFGPTSWYDPCARDLPKWVKWVCCWVFPYADGPSPPFQPIIKCPIMYDWIQWYVFFYVVAFYYSRSGTKILTGMISRLGCNSASWAVAAFGVSSLAGAAQAAFHYPNVVLESGVGSPGFHWWYIPLEFGVSMCQPLLVALAMAWFPFNMSWWGNTTLGTYALHFYFFQFMLTHSQKLLRWMSPVQGLPQLVVLLAMPIAFASTIGPLFHYFLLSPSFLGRRLKASAAYQAFRTRCTA